MKKPASTKFARTVGTGISVVLGVIGVIALHHALETPQPLKSLLAGESQLYVWRKRSVFYKVLGEKDAPPLVLLHTPEIGASAYEMQRLVEPLARSYRVYAPDLLGFGLSDRPGIDYSPELYKELCQDFLREVVRQPAMLVASKLSCNYAVSVAAQSPELCSSLALISPLSLGKRQPGQTWRTIYAGLPVIQTLLYALASTRLAFLLTHKSTQDFAQFYATTHQLGAEYAAMAAFTGKLEANNAQEFENLSQPVLLIWGTRALENASYLACLRETPRNHLNRSVELIQGAGLAVHREQPGNVVTAIERWQTERALPSPRIREDLLQTPLASMKNELPAALEKQGEPVPSASVAESDAVVAQDEDKIGEVLTYCVRCKKKTLMLHPAEFTMKNGRLAVRGACAICGTSTIRIGGRN